MMKKRRANKVEYEYVYVVYDKSNKKYYLTKFIIITVLYEKA